MVAPIITFLVAAGIGFLAWKTSTIEAYLPEDNYKAPPSRSAAAEPEEEAAEEPEAVEEPEEVEAPADEFEEMADPPASDDFEVPDDDDFDF